MFFGGFHCIISIGTFRNNFTLGKILQSFNHALSEDWMIVGDDNPDCLNHYNPFLNLHGIASSDACLSQATI